MSFITPSNSVFLLFGAIIYFSLGTSQKAVAAPPDSEHIYRERKAVDGFEGDYLPPRPSDLNVNSNADYWLNPSNLVGELKASRSVQNEILIAINVTNRILFCMCGMIAISAFWRRVKAH